MVNGFGATFTHCEAAVNVSIFRRDVCIDPVRGAESGASLPTYERKLPTRPGEQK